MKVGRACRFAAIGFVVLVGMAATSLAEAAEIGELVEVHAWINAMPPGPPRLLVQGKISAPTACYAATVEYPGQAAKDPSIYRVHVTLKPPTGPCAQTVSEVSFDYADYKYEDVYTQAEISSDHDTKTVTLYTAY